MTYLLFLPLVIMEILLWSVWYRKMDEEVKEVMLVIHLVVAIIIEMILIIGSRL